MRRGASALLAVGLAMVLGGASPAGAQPSVPREFFGIVPQGSLGAADFERMRGVVGTLRIPVYWPRVEPRAGDRDFAALDSIVSATASSGVRVLPFVYGTPEWLAKRPANPPLGPEASTAWRRFLRALVRRYGPGGELWASGRHRALPIHQWQIWNEPNFLLFWRPRPSPGGYARLLRISAQAVRAEDSGARIVAAGLAPVEGGMLPWTFLRRLYEAPDVRRHLDLVALHPYSSTLHGVVFQIRKARRIMARAGDGAKPLLVSEVGVASDSQFLTGFNWGREGQASFLRQAYGLLLRNRARWRIAGADWYAWQDLSAADAHCVFCLHAGLFDTAGRPKPAWWAFRRVATRPRAGV